MEEIKKRGRPQKEEARKWRYGLRLGTDEYDKLMYVQDETGQSPSDIFREGLDLMYKKYVLGQLMFDEN